MVLTAVRGAIAFLTRLPVGHHERAWEAFRTTPVSFPIVGYLIGAIAVIPLVLPLPPIISGVLYIGVIYGLTGVTHVDGLADLGDAMSVHGEPTDRRAVMRDSEVGAGGALAIGLVLVGLLAAGTALAAGRPPLRTVAAIGIAAEVGAKLTMAGIAGLGEATHEGLGSALADGLRPRSLLLPTGAALPVVLIAWPRSGPVAVTLIGAVVGGGLVFRWARGHLGGMSGDVLGAANEVARVTGLLAGVIAWTHW